MFEELVQLFQYNRWANHRILEAARGLPAQELDRDLGSSFPSIRATLVHMLSAEWIWLQRWRGSSPAAAPADWDLSTLDSIAARWRDLEQEQIAFLSTLDDEGLHAEVSYRNLKGERYANPLWQLLRHVVNHATYHRGQVTTMLRQVGASATSTDLVQFYREAGAEARDRIR